MENEKLMPTKEKMLEYLEGQKDSLLMGNFRNKVALRLQEDRLKDTTDKDEKRAIEDEIENINKANKGNAKYLEVIEAELKELK
jgi:hypothetical protein